MPYPIDYRRPAYVKPASTPSSERPSRDLSSPRPIQPASTGVPEDLSFDRVISGRTSRPCSIREFMDYLIHVEHAAENLQFYLWFRYYMRRFSHLPPNEKVLSQPWTPEKDSLLSARTPFVRPPPAAAFPNMFKGISFRDSYSRFEKYKNPFEDNESFRFGSDDETSTLYSSIRQDIEMSVAKAFEGADVKFRPFTVQPFHEEIKRIIATYIAPDAPRQLNLSARERNDLLQALAQTTHPSAFHNVIRTVEWTLRHQAHPNFIRWAICNCNRARIRFCGALGSTFLVGGLACLILLSLSTAYRPWRLISMLPLIIGVAMLYMVGNGVCLVLHLLHHHHLRPWELFVDSECAESREDLQNRSMDSFGSSNSYEDEPWIVRYKKRNLIRKIFDREEWIEDPALRKIHDTIFIQSLLVGLVAAIVVTGPFCAIPQMNMV